MPVVKTTEQIKKLHEKYGNELVYIVPYFLTVNVEDKFAKTKESDLDFIKANGKYVLRADAEMDISFQQIIPYIYVTDGTEYYITRRIKGDERLKDKLSIGVGGHINPCDGYDSPILKALEREVSEELVIGKYTTEYKGTVRDLSSTTPDHLGIVYEAVVSKKDKKKVKIRETDTLEGIWMTKEQLFQNYYKFESWARYIIEYIVGDKH